MYGYPTTNPNGLNISSRGTNHCLGSSNDQRYNHYQQTMSHFPTASPAAAAAFYPGVGGPQHAAVYGTNSRHRDQSATLNYQALSHSHYPSHPWTSQNVSSHNYSHLDPRQQMMAAANDQRYSQMSRYPMPGHGSSWPPGISPHQQLSWPHGSGQDPSSIMRSLAASSASVNPSNPHFHGLRFPSSSQVTNSQLHGWSSHHRSSSSSSTNNNNNHHPDSSTHATTFNHNVPYPNNHHRESSNNVTPASSSSRRQSSNHSHQSSGLTSNLLNAAAATSSEVTNSRSHCNNWRNLNGGHHASGPGSTHSESSSNHSTSPFGVLPHQESSQIGGPGSISSGYYSSSASSTGSAPASCMVAAYGHVGHNGLSDVSGTNVPGVAIAGGETNPNLSGVIPEEIEFPAIINNFPPEPYAELRLDPSTAASVTGQMSSNKLEKKSKSDRTKKKLEKRKNKEKSKEIEKADQVAASLFLQSMNPLNPFDFMNGQHGYPPFHHSKDPNSSQSLSHHEYHHHHLMPPNASFNNHHHHHHPLYPSQHYPPPANHPMMNGDLAMNSSNLLSSHMQSQQQCNNSSSGSSSNKSSSHNHSHSQTSSQQIHSNQQLDHDSQSPHGSVASSHASSMDHVMDQKLQQPPVQSQVMSQQQALIHHIHDQSQSSHGSITPHPTHDVSDKSQIIPSPQHVMSQPTQQNGYPQLHPPDMNSITTSAPSSIAGSQSENGAILTNGHDDNDKESTFAELEDDLRLLTEGSSDCTPSSNMILDQNHVAYTSPPTQEFNKSCLNSSGDSSHLIPSSNSANDSGNSVVSCSSRSKQPSLADTDPDLKNILDFIPDNMDDAVIETKIDSVPTSSNKRSSGCLVVESSQVIPESIPKKKKKKSSSKELKLVPAVNGQSKNSSSKSSKCDTVSLENGKKVSKIIDFRDIPIISRVETSKPPKVKAHKEAAPKSAEKPVKEKSDKSKKTKGSNDSKFFKTRPQSGAPPPANPVILPIEIEPLSSKNRINSSSNNTNYSSKSSKVVPIPSKNVNSVTTSSKKKKLSPSQEENKNMNVASHDEYEFKDSPSEPSRKKNSCKKDKKESQQCSTLPIVQSVVHFSPPPPPVVVPPKPVAQNAKKQIPPILTSSTSSPAVKQLPPAVSKQPSEKVGASSVKKSPSKSSSSRSKDISGVLSHLQPIAPKMTPIAPKCTATNIPIFIPAPVQSLAPVQDIKSLSKGKVQQIATTVVSLNTIAVPVQIMSKTSPTPLPKANSGKLVNSHSSKSPVHTSPRSKLQISPEFPDKEVKKNSKSSDVKKVKETPINNTSPSLTPNLINNNSPSKTTMSSVGVQSMGTNTPRRRSQDKKSATIREGLMRTQDFVVPMEDMSLDNPIIWRIEGKALLQKFEPSVQPDGSVIYSNTSSYSAWNPTVKQKFHGVDVRIMACSRTKITVEKMGWTKRKPSDNSNGDAAVSVEKLKPSTPEESSDELYENFEVFLQTLISQVLDSNFISEILAENDQYFVTNVQAIEEHCSRKKTKFFAKVKWDANIVKCVESYPNFSYTPQKNEGDLRCRLCHDCWSTEMLSFTGTPYDPVTLEERELTINIGGDLNGIKQTTKYAACDPCKDRVELFHQLHHQKYHFYLKCQEKVKELRAENEDKESHVIIEDCFEDVTWIKEMYKELESIWTKCDRAR